MNYNPTTGIVFCHGCPAKHYTRYYDTDYYVGRNITTETYVVGEQVRCLKCDSLLGYTKDAPEFFITEEEENG